MLNNYYDTNKDSLRCVIERITYQSQETGYKVLKCSAEGYNDLVTVIGIMPDTNVGSVLKLTGCWKVDSKYGRQFSVNTFEETLPATALGIEKYLGSGLVKGIGPAYAKKIVSTFGVETLNVIENEPDKLLTIHGIGQARVDRIKKSWEDQKEIKDIMIFLQGNGVSTTFATKIYKQYGSESIKKVRENPYRLADDIWGIGFKTADNIAAKMGFGHEKYERLRSGILFTLHKLSDEGHCYATKDILLNTGEELLEVEKDILSSALDEMIKAEDVKIEPLPTENDDNIQTAVYLPPFYYSEIGIAKRLSAIAAARRNIIVKNSQSLQPDFPYDPVQIEAIQTAAQSKILILTGGPGTGKTTTTLGIINAYKSTAARILLAAPTGRAAKRLSETTGMEAKTIHRLLEFKPPEGYQKNQDDPLEGDVLIIDECSMIDTMLMYNLLKAVPDTMTLIFVGDVDQLPSVGAGNVLRDMIESNVFPVIRLTKIFRQAQTSRIIMNAHKINKEQMPDLSNGRDTDFFFVEQEDPDAAAREIVDLVRIRLPKHYQVPSSSIQVLTPMQRGIVGAANMNLLLQEAVNPTGSELKHSGRIFRVNDRVMQIKNNYEKEVFNGDIGEIVSINTEDHELTVNFDSNTVVYDEIELDELVLAYATTIHKSQGSEYPIVIMPVMMTHYIMLQKNLIYTGVTRAKKVMVIVGTKKALAYAIHTMTANKRNTLLTQRLQTVQQSL